MYLIAVVIKEHNVHLTVLARGLEEKTNPKKTRERLSRHISKCGLHDTLTGSNIRKNKAKIHQMPTKTSYI
jgi:hypothetical protein